MLTRVLSLSSRLSVFCLLPSLAVQTLSSKYDVAGLEPYPPVKEFVDSVLVLAGSQYSQVAL